MSSSDHCEKGTNLTIQSEYFYFLLCHICGILTRVAAMWVTFILISGTAVTAEPQPKNIKFPLPNPSELGAKEFSDRLNKFLVQRGFAKWHQDNSVRTTGAFEIKDSGEIRNFGTHGTFGVKLYYSPEVVAWMLNERKGLIADGGMIIKELYERRKDDPAKFQKRASRLQRDGEG